MSYWKNKHVVVTGGAGMIGSYLVELLVHEGALVKVLDNFERGRKENLQSVRDDIEVLGLDLSEPINCLWAFEGAEVVFNLAAKVAGIDFNRLHQSIMFYKNMHLQQNPLMASLDQRVDHFIQVSSACVYPAGIASPIPEWEGIVSEPEPSNSGYGWAKRMGEKLAVDVARETSMKVSIVRPFNAYSPRDYYDSSSSHVIPALIKKVMDGENPINVWGTGNQRRAFIHAKDIARGMMLVAQYYPAADPVNIGHDKDISIKALLEKIQAITGIHSDAVFDSSKPDGHKRRSADMDKLNTVTGGFMPQVSLDEGLMEMIAKYERERVK